ncbi:ROK family protein [Actinopolymorpha alba]|uniref:ROK family protein n=1 Tax=Actinopolymorpha alba TaxID=533267 RepID=UPI003B509C44
MAATLARTLGCPVVVENDANLAAISERWQGIASDADDVVVLVAGERTGAGIVIGGQLVRGKRSGTGEMTFLGLLRAADPDQEIEQIVQEVAHPRLTQLS